jgi:Nif-specific regulatory protein
LANALDGGRATSVAAILHLEEAAAGLMEESRDPRLRRLLLGLHELREHLERQNDLVVAEHLDPLSSAAVETEAAQRDGRLAPVMRLLLAADGMPPARLAEALLDTLLASTRAQRGFLLLYHPTSTEAEVVAAREFASRNLSVEEYDFSRSLLRRVLATGSTLLIEDALASESFAQETTVRRLRLRSVLVVPLLSAGRPLGAVYLENNREPAALAAADARLTEEAAALAVEHLARRHLLPHLAGGAERVFIDSSRAVAELVGATPAILELRAKVLQLADAPATILIVGESGTGKELVARALHYESHRRERPFVAINCAAIPEHLLESELFGHERGAFTGAGERHIGRLEQAQGGTVLLDEISELPASQQAKLLRFLQSGEIQRVGGGRTLRLEVRIVAATSRDLGDLVAARRFQEALYYRLHVVPLHVPALRERRPDIPLLIEHFRRKFCELYSREIRFAPEIAAFFERCEWPGNARELENLVHRLVALARSDVLHLGDLPSEVLGQGQRVALAKDPVLFAGEELRSLDDLRRLRAAVRSRLRTEERRIAEQAVREEASLTRAASRLGIHRVTLHKLLREVDEEGGEAPPTHPDPSLRSK